MKFNPITRDVFSDKGQFVKKLSCPFRIQWDELKASDSDSRRCSVCDNDIIDTALLKDDEIIHRVKSNEKTCLKIDLNQENVRIVTHGI